MKQIRILPLLTVLILTPADIRQSTTNTAAVGASPPAARVVDLKAADGIILKASYFAAAKPGPGVLLLHQINRTRKAWDELAGQLAAATFGSIVQLSCN
jgi:hypothetical protein